MLSSAILHFTVSVVGAEGISHDVGFVHQVVFGSSQSFACVGFVGNCELSPGDPELVGYTGFVSFAVGGCEGSFGIGVPCELAKPMCECLPRTVGDGVGVAVVLEVDIGVAKIARVDNDRVVDVCVPARPIVFMLVVPRIVRVDLDRLTEGEFTADVWLLVNSLVL